MIQNEVAILRRVKHPNIVLLIEEVDTYSELYLVMELVKVGCKNELKITISRLGKLQNDEGFPCSELHFCRIHSKKSRHSLRNLQTSLKIRKTFGKPQQTGNHYESTSFDLNPAQKHSVNLNI